MRRRTEQTERIAPFAEHSGAADEIAEKSIQSHHRARGLVALGAQARAQHLHHRLAHGIRNLHRGAVRNARRRARCSANRATGWTRRASSSPHVAPAKRVRAQHVAAATIAAVGASLGCSENRSGMTWPSVVMPVNGAFASSAQPPNSSWARGLCSRACVCSRGVAPAMRDCPGAGTNGRKSERLMHWARRRQARILCARGARPALPALQMVVICSIALNVECRMIRDSVNNHLAPRGGNPYSSIALRGMHSGYSVASKRQMRTHLSQKFVAFPISHAFA